jgi:hypothetical protein
MPLMPLKYLMALLFPFIPLYEKIKEKIKGGASKAKQKYT